MKNNDEIIKNDIKRLLKELGADVCGIAAAKDFYDAPSGFRPQDILSSAGSVISFGFALPKGLFDTDKRIIYGYYNYFICNLVDSAALKASNALEAKYGCSCVPMPSDSPYEYWEADKLRGMGLMSMKHAAVKAGLGQLGKSTLLLNPTYGNRLVLGLIVTDLMLSSDPAAPDICKDNCNICRKACPVGAISDEGVDQFKCRNNTYGVNERGQDVVKCSNCRMLCPRSNGL